ncbi:MAG: hypothetical protein U1F51_01960 [Burkholderiales bacterium]
MQRRVVGHQRESRVDGRPGGPEISGGQRDLGVADQRLGVVVVVLVRGEPRLRGLRPPTSGRERAGARLQAGVPRLGHLPARGVARAHDALVALEHRIGVGRIDVPYARLRQTQSVDGERLAHVDERRVRRHLQPKVPVVEPVERGVVADTTVADQRGVEHPAVGREQVATQ